jgi:hypothetical protein
MRIQLLCRTATHDKEGKVTSDTGFVPANSFTIGFLEVLNSLMIQHAIYGVGHTHNIVDVTGSTFVFPETYSGSSGWDQWDRMSMAAAAAADHYGIVVGTDNTAESLSDYALNTQATEGTGTDEFNHGAHAFSHAAVSGSNVDFIVSRTFTNNSGATITVREIGIYVQQMSQSGRKWVCVARDVLSSPVDVIANQVLTVEYTLRTTI